jgi:hypothetical protein
VRWFIPSQRSSCIDDEHGGNAKEIEKERERGEKEYVFQMLFWSLLDQHVHEQNREGTQENEYTYREYALEDLGSSSAG